MASKSLQQIRDAIRNRGDFRDPQFPDGEMDIYINDSIAALWDVMIDHDSAFAIASAPIDVTCGTRAYELPSDFYILLGVDIPDPQSGSGYRDLQRFEWAQRNAYPKASGPFDTRYDVRGGQLWLHPTPSWSDTLQIYYIPTAPQLIHSTDTFDSQNTWVTWVQIDVHIVCALKLDQSTRGLERALQRAEARIFKALPKDAGNPKVMTIATHRGDYRQKRMPRR